MISSLRQLTGTLVDGLRSVLLLRPRASAYTIDLPAIILLCMLNIGAIALFEYALDITDSAFQPFGIVVTVAHFGVLIAYLSLLPFALAGAAPARLFVALTALTAIWLALVAAALLSPLPVLSSIERAGIDPIVGARSIAIALAGWISLAAARLGFGLAERWRLASGIGLVAVSILSTFTFPLVPIFQSQDIAQLNFSVLRSVITLVQSATEPAARAEAPVLPRIDIEATLNRQPALLATTLAAIAAPREDRAEIYFVGMAPYASQDVFKREIMAVKDLFDSRFDTTGRSLALINHRSTIAELPLATMTNLNAVLRHLGRTMRPARDVLLLFVTSHGIKGEVAVDFPGFPLNGLTPERLAMALDDAGIVNRVLVISACHSGSFIERLKTDNSLIMTAAHEDRTSFGCSNEAEWTYFGDAYFNQALRSATSFVDAFVSARDLIAAWEKRDNVEASEPQIFVGSTIQSKLDAITAARLNK